MKTHGVSTIVFSTIVLAAAANFIMCSSSGSKSVNAEQTATLRPVTETFTVNPNTEQDITTTDGVGVRFPAGTFETAEGDTPPDEATLTLTSYLKQQDGLVTDMPGGFEGIDKDDNTVALASYGVLGVSIEANGQPLKVKDDGHVDIVIPALDSAGPQTIPLWYREDETSSSVWREEGEASLDGNGNYIGEVHHFSLWNADGPCDRACMKVQAEKRDGTAIKGLIIQARVTQTNCFFASPGALSGGSCITDENGTCTIENIPQDSTLTVSGQYQDEDSSDTAIVPASGSECLDGPKLVFGEETTTKPTEGVPCYVNWGDGCTKWDGVDLTCQDGSKPYCGYGISCNGNSGCDSSWYDTMSACSAAVRNGGILDWECANFDHSPTGCVSDEDCN